MKLTALIPAHNDAYTLRLCLASIVEHFDQICVLDDASTDETPGLLADFARRHGHVKVHTRPAPPAGWVTSREMLLSSLKPQASRLLFWLDADDVLCEYNADLLREIAAGDAPLVRLQLCEMWGDLNHSTQRLRHYDRCHLFVDRAKAADFHWEGGAMARPVADVGARHASPSKGPLFFHLKGVKPDRRLVERQLTRKWLRGALKESPAAIVAKMADSEVHERALKMLFNSRQDRLKPAYLECAHVPRLACPAVQNAPRRPQVILDELARGQRFEIIYKDGRPVDRLDHGPS